MKSLSDCLRDSATGRVRKPRRREHVGIMRGEIQCPECRGKKNLACAKCDGRGVLECPDCEGRCVVFVATGVTYCKCQPEVQIRHNLERANLPAEVAEATVFQFLAMTELQHAARNFLVTWIRAFAKRRPKSVYIWGPCGTGKTHLACATLKAIAQEYRAFGLYRSLPQLLADARDLVQRGEDVDRLIEECHEADLLVLDDLGAGHTATSFALDVIYRILNGRMDKPTIVTGNLTVQALEDIEPRIASRIRACHQLPIDGDDYRARGNA